MARIIFVLLLSALIVSGMFGQSAPNARNFAYPQSLFIDSQNGNIWVADFDNNRILRFDVSTLTGLAGEFVQKTAVTYELDQNFPNPFNPHTTIRFSTPQTELATVKVFDVLGREVATLFNGTALAGRGYSVTFTATNLPSGLYFYMLRTDHHTQVKKMGLLK